MKIFLRSLHVLCSGVLTGSYVFAAGAPHRSTWLTFTMLSAVVLLLLDLHESGAFLLQVRGYLVLLKVGALGVLPWLDPAGAAWLLGSLVVASVLSSHAPSRVRYAFPLGGSHLRGARTKG